MTGKTHAAAGMLAALLIGTTAPGMVLVGLGALLPDIDHSGSKLGSKAKPVSRVLRHRGVTHSLAFLLLSFLVNPLIGVGVLTHLLLDFLTPKGEELLWPFHVRFRLPGIKRRFETGSRGETIVFLLISGLTVLIVCKAIWNARPEIHGLGSLVAIWRGSLDMLTEGLRNAGRVIGDLIR